VSSLKRMDDVRCDSFCCRGCLTAKECCQSELLLACLLARPRPLSWTRYHQHVLPHAPYHIWRHMLHHVSRYVLDASVRACVVSCVCKVACALLVIASLSPPHDQSSTSLTTYLVQHLLHLFDILLHQFDISTSSTSQLLLQLNFFYFFFSLIQDLNTREESQPSTFSSSVGFHKSSLLRNLSK